MKLFKIKKVFAGALVVTAVSMLGLGNLMADEQISSNNTNGAVAQIDVGAINGGVISKESGLGSSVKKGQVVLVLDKTPYVNQLEADKAKLADDTQIYNRNELLNKKESGLVPQQELLSSKYAVEGDKGTVKLDETYVRECTVKAPFSGKVTKVINYPGTGIGSGNEVLDITAG